MSELETEALKRKERLKLLKSKRAIDQENTSAEQGKQPEKPKLKFRSYNPQTESLKETKLPKAKPNAVEPEIQDVLKSAKDNDIGDVNLANLAPRKVDWDLKRDIAKKLDKLERRTQKAIVEIVQSRLAGPKEGEIDLAAAVAIAGKEQTEYDSD
ncbi:coiled-coil domain-containing protein 12-like [Halichondria panicea]|uniref:coiled-coil domain-containing protein 12-like n=1 Tax=Halichondria panicea TaxID=6063 RepID=UPI00312B3370